MSQQSAAGWRAQIELRFQADEGRTRLSHQRHSGPLMVQRSFHPEDFDDTGASAGAVEPCHVYLIHPPGGVVSGDELQIDVDLEPGAHALLTTPAAGKFYRRGGEQIASVSQTLRVDRATMEWLPQENIFYPDSVAQISTIARLTAGARFIGWEIACLGLPANSLSLGQGSIRQSVELWCDSTPLLLERVLIDRDCLSARWGMAGCVAMGSWLAFPATPAHLSVARSTLEHANCADMQCACTLVDGVLCCRAIAARADHLKQLYILLWGALRPGLLGRGACAPRIWAT